LQLGDLPRTQFETAGFPADREGNLLWRDPKRRIYNFHFSLGLLAPDCAARAGASGAPIPARIERGALRMVAMIVQETFPSAEVIRTYDAKRSGYLYECYLAECAALAIALNSLI
jgi:hypothetical protein